MVVRTVEDDLGLGVVGRALILCAAISFAVNGLLLVLPPDWVGLLPIYIANRRV